MDRLSDLSDGILHQIYSWMLTEEAVRMSVLSKRFNGLWLTSPDLLFDTYKSVQRHDNFTEFINQTLIFRGGSKVKSFRIILFLNRSYSRHLDLWMRYALQNEAEQILLDLVGDDIFYIPPQFSYFSSSLTSLRLQMCRIWLRKGVGWTSLKTLILQFVIVFQDAIRQVLLGCPQLESLELLDCAGYDVLSIYSTSLKRLVIADSTILSEYISEGDLEISAPNVESICMSGDLYRKCMLKDLSSLLHASLYFLGRVYRTEDFDEEQFRLLEVLESLEHVKNLKLGEWCIKLLSIRVKKGLPCRPLKCKCLILNTSLKQEDILGILLLMKCSSDLETLTLNITSPTLEQYLYDSKVGMLADFCNFAGDRYLNSQVDGIPCLQLKLRTIQITHFVDQNLVLPFIKFMLKEARVLKNMEIRSKYLDPNSPLDSLFNVAQKLSDTPKSSHNAVVKLHNFDGKVTLTIS